MSRTSWHLLTLLLCVTTSPMLCHRLLPPCLQLHLATVGMRSWPMMQPRRPPWAVCWITPQGSSMLVRSECSRSAAAAVLLLLLSPCCFQLYGSFGPWVLPPLQALWVGRRRCSGWSR